MPAHRVKILVTGPPGCGKTTAIMKIVSYLNCEKIAGFYTQEIRVKNIRKGFSWHRFNGPAGILAHTDIKSPFKVGKYSVDVTGFEKSVVSVLQIQQSDASLFVIDEIGKMECLSQKFTSTVRQLFTSEKPVLATIALKGSGLISELKSYPGITMFHLNRRNFNNVVAEIADILSFLKSPSQI